MSVLQHFARKSLKPQKQALFVQNFFGLKPCRKREMKVSNLNFYSGYQTNLPHLCNSGDNDHHHGHSHSVRFLQRYQVSQTQRKNVRPTSEHIIPPSQIILISLQIFVGNCRPLTPLQPGERRWKETRQTSDSFRCLAFDL